MDKTKTIQISDIGEVITGNTPPRKNSEYYGDYTLFIKPTDISKDSKYTYNPEECYSEIGYEKYKKTLIPQGATCVVTIGSIGEKLTKAHTDCFINQAMNAVIPNEKYDEDYVYYVLKYNLKQLKMFDSGTASGRENVSKSAFSSININVLTKKDNQIKVGKILSNYDDLIENNNKRIKILEEMAQKIYKEWFVDFKFPGYETTTFKQTELGKIPSDWNSKPIGELLEHQIGGGWGNEEQSDKYTESAYVIRGADIPNGRDGNIQNCPLRYHTKSNIKTRLLKANDIVFEVSGGSKGQPVGRALLLNKNLFNQFNDNVICASFCKLLRTDTKQILPEIVYLHLLNIYNNGKIEKYQTQSTGIINFKFTFFLENEQILVPNDTIQELFKNITLPIFDEISLLGYKNQALKQTRDLLLPRLISGEIDVENMEIK
ncbi:restriction modification system DNA specificity domain [Clostridium sp. CAG:715]|nr:restriction modification system DNA specificity domain [Clostridium sp. CAG:715]